MVARSVLSLLILLSACSICSHAARPLRLHAAQSRALKASHHHNATQAAPPPHLGSHNNTRTTKSLPSRSNRTPAALPLRPPRQHQPSPHHNDSMTVSSLLAHPRQQLRRDRNYSLASTPSACEGDKHCVYFFTLDDDSKLPAPSVWLASAFGCTSDCGGDWGWESPFVISGSNQVALPFTGPFEGCTRTCYVTPNDYGDDEDYFLLWTTVKYNIPVPNYSVDVTCQGHIGMSYDIWGNHISSLETNYGGLQPPTFGPQCMLCSAQVTNTNTGKTTTMPTSQYSSFWMCQHSYYDLMLYFNYPSYCNDSDYCDEYEDECEDGSECDEESEEVAEEIAEDLAEEIEEVVQVLEGLCELLCWFL